MKKFEKSVGSLPDVGTRISIPCIPARGEVILPGVTHTISVGRKKSVSAVKKALASESELLFVTAQKNKVIDNPRMNDLYEIGTVVKVQQIVETAGGVFRCLLTGVARARLVGFPGSRNGFAAEVEIMNDFEAPSEDEKDDVKVLSRMVKSKLAQYLDSVPVPFEQEAEQLKEIDEPEKLLEMAALCVDLNFEDKQKLLELDFLVTKLTAAASYIQRELELLEMEQRISRKVQEAINQNQREFYVREQIKALQEEIGENADAQGDMEEVEKYRKNLDGIKNISETAYDRISEEIDRLAKTPSYSQEASLIRSYLDMCLSLPWDEKTEETPDVDEASRILDEDHYGIRKVKDRILENIAVRALTPDIKGQILCLSGPPGVGKTSVAKSIARALGRKFVRVSLGGVRDESDIRGHRKTYLGAMPGRIIMGLKQAGSSNPVMLLDEIDKMSNDFKGDPSSAMLEVLDSEQNSQFRDHYTEIPFDLSEVLFIATANNLSEVSAPLLDRMEIIELSSYTREEKFNIAKEHLVPKQLKKYGLTQVQVKFNDSAIYSLIDFYTREAGVRKLEQEIGSLCRKAAKKLVSGESKVSFKASNIEEYLGHKKYLEDFYIKKPSVGCVNGLAWTSVGGVIMPLETLVLDGKGKVTVTGSLGDVMKESSSLAVTNARRLSEKYGISPDFYEKKDLFIHAPEGATPKDGPSAGVTMTTAMISALSGIKVRGDVAMTGEITLTGKVLPIGGLKEKTMAAYKSGMKTVVIPKANEGDLDDIDEVVKASLEFVTAEKIEDVLDVALITEDTNAPKKKRGRPKKQDSEAKPAAEVV